MMIRNINKLLKITLCCLTASFLITGYSFAQETEDVVTTEKFSLNELLCGYLENDIDLKKLTLGIEKSKLALEETKIDQGFDITLSTGTMSFYSNSAGSAISVKPSVKASLPKAKNLSASVSTDYTRNTSTKTDTLKDTKFSASFDLISQTEASQKITLLKSERALLESQRSVQSAALTAEKNFYSELEDLLKQVNDIYSSLKDVYTDKLNFDKIKAQGYNRTSSTYRLAEMKVLTGQHDIETGYHNLKHDVVVFYQHCGKTINIEDEKEIIKYIPADIPEVELLSFEELPKEKYSALESAKWTNNINSLTRKADKYFSLGFNGGYTINNSTTKSDTIDAGVSTTIGGVGLNAGVSLPVGINDLTPAFTLSATVNPNTFLKRNIKDKTYDLTDQQEKLDIQKAEQKYSTAIVDYKESASNLIWEKDSVSESLDLYKKNETDLLKYYKNGIVTESEWLSALNSRQLYEVKQIMNKISFLTYNNEVRSQFVDLENSDNEENE